VRDIDEGGNLTCAVGAGSQVLRFRSTLIQAGRVCTVRDSRGDDEMAACGQLGDVGALGARAPVLHAPLRFQKALLAPV
jgi:23S rRNA (adenine2503-C2)-methyltransferase